MIRPLTLSLLSVILFSGNLQAEAISKTFEGIEALEYMNGSGDLKIKASANTQSRVDARKIRADRDCEIEIEKSGKVLKVATHSRAGDCQVDFVLELPKTVDLNLKMGSGNAQVRGTKGSLNFKTGSGDVDFDGEATKVDGMSGSGDISLAGMIGSSELKSGSGDITLAYAQAPAGAKLDIRSGSGDSSLILPATTKIKTDFRAGSGEVRNAFPESADSNFVVSMRSGSGDLNIKKVQ